MIAVIFEVWIKDGHREAYLELAAGLRDLLTEVPGFMSIERFQSLTEPNKIMSLSLWESEEALAAWRALPNHRKAQSAGRALHFDDYHLRVAGVIRDYGMNERDQAPEDSRQVHDS